VRVPAAAVLLIGSFALPAVAEESRVVLTAAADGSYPVPIDWQPCDPAPSRGLPFSGHAFRPPAPEPGPVTLLFREKEGDACHPIAFKLSRRLLTPSLLHGQGRARWRPDLSLRMEIALPLQPGWAAGDVPAKLRIPGGARQLRPLTCSATECVATFRFASRDEARQVLGPVQQTVELAEVLGPEGAAGWSIYEPEEGTPGATKVTGASAAEITLYVPDKLTGLEFPAPGGKEVQLTSIESAFLSGKEPISCKANGAGVPCKLKPQERALELSQPLAAGEIISASITPDRLPRSTLELLVLVAASEPEVLTVVAPQGASTIALPGDRFACEAMPDAVTDKGKITLTGRPAGRFGVLVVPRGGDCEKKETRASILLEVVPPILLARDVDQVLLERDPGAPTHLKVLLHSAVLAGDERIRATTELRVPPGGVSARAPTTCGGADGHWCAFDLERSSGWDAAARVVDLSVSPASAVRGPRKVYRADGTELGSREQSLKDVETAWKIPAGAENPVGALRPPAAGGKVEVPVRSLLARLFTASAGATPCRRSDDKVIPQCARVAGVDQDALKLEIDWSAVQKVPGTFTSLDVPLKTNGVKLATGDASPFFDELTVRVAIAGTACAYQLTQLTETFADLDPGLVFFRVAGSPQSCPGPRTWSGRRILAPPKAGSLAGAPQIEMDVLWFDGLPDDVFAVQLAGPLPPGAVTLTLKDGARPGAESTVTVKQFGPRLHDLPQIEVTLATGEQDVTQFGLVEDKDNRLTFATEGDLEPWRLALDHSSLRSCAGGEALGPDFCVHPLYGTTGEARVVAQYLAAVPRDPGGPLRPPLALASLFTADGRFVAGSLGVRLGTVGPWKKAINLDERAWVECGKHSSPASWSPFQARTVKAWATTGTRAATVGELRTCTLAVDMSGAMRENPTIPQEAARKRANDSATRLLDEFRPQEIDVDVQVFPPGAAENAEPTSARSLHFTIDFPQLREAMEDAVRRGDNDADVVHLSLEIDPNGANPVVDYGTIRVKARHHAPAEYKELKDSAPNKGMVATLRRLPDVLAGRFPSILQQAFHMDGGSGWRAYVTFSLPTAMLRAPNLNRSITSSTKYDSIETVALGVGGAAILEPWDFDHNIALLTFNPQAHLGFFLSELPRGNDPLPRVSIVAGVGARLPFGLSAEDRNTNLRTVLWYELSRRERSNWEAAVLAGFAVNFGNFPN
jgi:hypothetical protein